MHDANGVELKVGDIVTLELEIKQIHPGEDYCNCILESVLGRRPDGLKETLSSVNTGVLVKKETEAVTE